MVVEIVDTDLFTMAPHTIIGDCIIFCYLIHRVACFYRSYSTDRFTYIHFKFLNILLF